MPGNWPVRFGGRLRGKGPTLSGYLAAWSTLPGTITTELLPTLPGHMPPGNNGRAVSAPVLSLSELDTAIGRFITVDYHRRTHQETGQPPIERWLNSGWRAEDARIVGATGSVAVDRRDAAEGAPGWDPLSWAAISGPDVGHLRRGAGHRPPTTRRTWPRSGCFMRGLGPGGVGRTRGVDHHTEGPASRAEQAAVGTAN